MASLISQLNLCFSFSIIPSLSTLSFVKLNITALSFREKGGQILRTSSHSHGVFLSFQIRWGQSFTWLLIIERFVKQLLSLSNVYYSNCSCLLNKMEQILQKIYCRIREQANRQFLYVTIYVLFCLVQGCFCFFLDNLHISIKGDRENYVLSYYNKTYSGVVIAIENNNDRLTHRWKIER